MCLVVLCVLVALMHVPVYVALIDGLVILVVLAALREIYCVWADVVLIDVLGYSRCNFDGTQLCIHCAQ